MSTEPDRQIEDAPATADTATDIEDTMPETVEDQTPDAGDTDSATPVTAEASDTPGASDGGDAAPDDAGDASAENDAGDADASAGDDATGGDDSHDEPPPEPPAPPAKNDALAPRPGFGWYVLRVASNKEDQVREALERKVTIEGLEERIGRIVVPTQTEKRMRAGVARIYQRKLYPGYVFVEMCTEEDGSIPEHVWFMVKETTGVGDFIGSGGKPSPMSQHDAEKMLMAAERSAEEQPGLGIPFRKGDRVKIREGSFESFEGDVENVDEAKGVVTVLLTIFGRSTPVDVEYWQLEKL